MATDLRPSEAAVVGAGVIGLTTALTLLERGVACTVYAERRVVSLRIRGEEKDAGSLPLAAFVSGIAAEIAERRAGLGVQP